MYKIGDKVLHQKEGACYITEIVDKKMDKETNQYYLLESVIDRKSAVYVSTSKDGRFRAVIDKTVLKEAESNLNKDAYLWPEDPKDRYRIFNKKIEKFNFEEVMEIFSSLTLENRKKKLLLRDESQRQICEKLICSEIAIVLNKSYEFVTEEVTKFLLAEA